MPAKKRSNISKWILAVCVLLGLVLWWCSRPAGRVQPAMVLIPAGDFQMGDQSMPKIGNPNELPVHTVRVSAFYIGNCEVTKSEWDAVRGWGKDHGFTDLLEGGGKAPDHPVQGVSWYDVVKWCNARSRMEGLTPCYTVAGAIYQTGWNQGVDCDWSANGYRLPTEAEWEKAARGGKVGKNYPWGDSISHRRANYRRDTAKTSKMEVLWERLRRALFPGKSVGSGTLGFHPEYASGNEPYTSPVGSFSSNGCGLFDMSGNVWEWCWDWYGGYMASPQTDPRGGASRRGRVLRGDSWGNLDSYARCSFRGDMDPDYKSNSLGFRLVRHPSS